MKESATSYLVGVQDHPRIKVLNIYYTVTRADSIELLFKDEAFNHVVAQKFNFRYKNI
jgi:hypothetical protein